MRNQRVNCSRAVSASARANAGFAPSGVADGLYLVEQRTSPHLVLARRGAQFRHRQQRQRPLVRRFAGVREGERCVEMRCRIVVPARLGVEFAEQAMGGEQGERLARLGGVGEGALGVLAGLAPCRPPAGDTAPRAPAPRTGRAPPRSTPASGRAPPAIPCAVAQVARVERQRRRQALQRQRIPQRHRPRLRPRARRQHLLAPSPTPRAALPPRPRHDVIVPPYAQLSDCMRSAHAASDTAARPTPPPTAPCDESARPPCTAGAAASRGARLPIRSPAPRAASRSAAVTARDVVGAVANDAMEQVRELPEPTCMSRGGEPRRRTLANGGRRLARGGQASPYASPIIARWPFVLHRRSPTPASRAVDAVPPCTRRLERTRR